MNFNELADKDIHTLITMLSRPTGITLWMALYSVYVKMPMLQVCLTSRLTIQICLSRRESC